MKSITIQGYLIAVFPMRSKFGNWGFQVAKPDGVGAGSNARSD